MFKAKGFESFPPTTQTEDFSPSKGKHKLAQEKLFTLDTNMCRLFSTDVPNSLQIIQYAWNSTCQNEDNFAEGGEINYHA